MIDIKELIEEIEIFEKLDVKYLLEELEKKSSLDFTKTTQEAFELNNETTELIIKSLILLINEDEKFALDVQDAIGEVNKRNKVADIGIAGIAIGSGITLLLCLLLRKSDNKESGDIYGAMHNEGEINYDFHIGNVSEETLKNIIKEYVDKANES